MSDLKPCMCCESNDIEIITYEEKYHSRKIAKCMNCGARGSVCDSKEEAIEAWNTRPAEDVLTAEIERLKKTIKEIRNIADKGFDMGIDFIGAGLDGMTGGVEDWQGMKRAKRKIRKLAKQALKKTTNAPDTNVGTMEEN